jgi:hypothetical protein
MDIKYINKPSQELLNQYCAKIEYFLSMLGVKLKITLFDMPGIMDSSTNNLLVSKEALWLNDFIVTTPLGEFKLRHKPRLGIEEAINDHEIWSDAWAIQNEIYNRREFNLPTPNIDDSDDPYWNLWKKIPQ